MNSVYYANNAVQLSFEDAEYVETAKAILENNDAILKELDHQIYDILEAIRGKRAETRDDMAPCDDSMLATLKRQRDLSERILKTAMSIKEALW